MCSKFATVVIFCCYFYYYYFFSYLRKSFLFLLLLLYSFYLSRLYFFFLLFTNFTNFNRLLKLHGIILRLKYDFVSHFYHHHHSSVSSSLIFLVYVQNLFEVGRCLSEDECRDSIYFFYHFEYTFLFAFC
jgi:hypothetical protein